MRLYCGGQLAFTPSWHGRLLPTVDGRGGMMRGVCCDDEVHDGFHASGGVQTAAHRMERQLFLCLPYVRWTGGGSLMQRCRVCVFCVGASLLRSLSHPGRAQEVFIRPVPCSLLKLIFKLRGFDVFMATKAIYSQGKSIGGKAGAHSRSPSRNVPPWSPHTSVALASRRSRARGHRRV